MPILKGRHVVKLIVFTVSPRMFLGEADPFLAGSGEGRGTASRAWCRGLGRAEAPQFRPPLPLLPPRQCQHGEKGRFHLGMATVALTCGALGYPGDPRVWGPHVENCCLRILPACYFRGQNSASYQSQDLKLLRWPKGASRRFGSLPGWEADNIPSEPGLREACHAQNLSLAALAAGGIPCSQAFLGDWL